MKPFYHVVFFFTFFQLSALIIAGMSVFPTGTTLYSDFEIDVLEENSDNPSEALAYIFMPNGTKIGSFDIFGYEFGGFELNSFSIMAVLSLIIIGGAAFSIVAHSFIPAALAVLGLSFLPMLTHSYSFFNKVFTIGDNTSMIYLGLTLMVGVLAMFVITIVEMVAQGRS